MVTSPAQIDTHSLFRLGYVSPLPDYGHAAIWRDEVAASVSSRFPCFSWLILIGGGR